jgi:hypothetical protein
VNLEYLHTNKHLQLLTCISGSKAYGLDTPQSDTDIKGVFYLPLESFYGLEYTPQVSNETNDEVHYELARFIDLLGKNNPNILELLATPVDCVLYKHHIIDTIKPGIFLSKLCCQTFAGYAIAQIKKAKGLNKKIVNPIDKERKNILHFCYAITGSSTMPLTTWLASMKYNQHDCGLVKLDHFKDCYALFHSSQLSNTGSIQGIYSGIEANDVSLSSIEKDVKPAAIISFNKDGYSTYCKDYKEYWHWVENRNEARYENTVNNNQNYDAKNMMHVFRLLAMAEDIALKNEVIVKRHEREFLLSIKHGGFTYDDLVKRANDKLEQINEMFAKSDLPEKPDDKAIAELLVSLRKELYQKNYS